MPLIVGVDAGGSATIAAAQRDDAAPVVRTCEGANPRAVGVAAAAATVADAAAAALAGAAPDAVAVGAAGFARRENAAMLERVLQARFPSARVSVEEDVWIALRAAIPAGEGMALVAGTGSIAAAEIDGRRSRCGGYGSLLSDEGSGYAIGAAALRALLRHYDGRAPREPFLDALESQLGADDPQGVLAAVYDATSPVAAIAACAPVVLSAADSGERTPSKIVQAAALELFDLLKTLARGYGAIERSFPLALCGGLLRRNSLLSFLLETRIGNEMPHATLVKAPPEPYVGALARARALLQP